MAMAGPEGRDAICCSHFARVARWTWSHRSGSVTDSIWPLNNSVATSLTRVRFMLYRNIVTEPRGSTTASADARWPYRSESRVALFRSPMAWIVAGVHIDQAPRSRAVQLDNDVALCTSEMPHARGNEPKGAGRQLSELGGIELASHPHQ